MAMGM